MNSRHETERITCNGVTLNVIRAGPTNGAPVVLLHGFPEPASLCWQRQIRPLGEAGLRLLAPDQRGYNTSDKPEGVAAYTLDVLAADVLGILDAQGLPTAALVGHDWGGIVAWWTALRHPQRVERLAILNAPHPVAGQRYILTHPRQMLKSWYVFFFQLPGLPEAHLKRGNWRPLCRALQKTNRPGIFTENDLDEYRRAWSEPGAIKAMINWYRALVRHRPGPPPDPRVHTPTLVIWGTEDRFLSRELAEASLTFCDQGRLEWVEGATHWVQHEEPQRVNRLLIDFLGGQDKIV
jgi:pimeloyl-ACP methyl ester carboxylesterase